MFLDSSCCEKGIIFEGDLISKYCVKQLSESSVVITVLVLVLFLFLGVAMTSRSLEMYI